MKVVFILNMFIVMAFLPAPVRGGDYRCADRIISVGDTSSELLMRCGEPDWTEFYAEEIIEAMDEDNERKTVIPVEEWTYDAGPDRFMRIVTLRGGRVADIRTGDYGLVKQRHPQAPCSEQVISVGDTAAEVWAKCGEPFHKDWREEIVSERLDDNTVLNVSVNVEEWTYNSGPDRFLRIFSFRNGKITAMRTGGYGN